MAVAGGGPVAGKAVAAAAAAAPDELAPPTEDLGVKGPRGHTYAMDSRDPTEDPLSIA
jgi:hypothetical protein